MKNVKFTCFVYCCLAIITLSAQTVQVNWVLNNSAGKSNTWIHKLVSASDGNIYFIGKQEDGFTIGSESARGSYGGIVIGKMDNNGNEVWLKKAGSIEPFNDDTYTIQLDKDQNVYISAYVPILRYAQFDNTELDRLSGGALVKFNKDGVLQWLQGVSGFILALEFDQHNVLHGVINYSTIKTLNKSDGEILNDTLIVDPTRTGGAVSHKLKFDESNNLYFLSGNKFLKYDSLYKLLWDIDVTGLLTQISDFDFDIDGNVLCVIKVPIGSSAIGNKHVVGSNEPSINSNSYLVKLDATTGNVLYLDSLTYNNKPISLTKIKRFEDNTYLLANDVKYNSYLLKLDQKLDQEWVVNLGPNITIQDFDVKEENCFLISGNHNHLANLGGVQLSVPGNNAMITKNAFIADICVQPTIIEDPAFSEGISMYPNPANQIVYIDSDQIIKEVTLTGASGKSEEYKMINNSLDVSVTQNGIYVVTFIDNNILVNKKLCILK